MNSGPNLHRESVADSSIGSGNEGADKTSRLSPLFPRGDMKTPSARLTACLDFDVDSIVAPKSKMRWAALALTGVCAACLIPFGMHRTPNVLPGPIAAPLEPAKSQLHELGTIEAHQETAVLSHLTGEIVWKTEEGKLVEAGEPLLRFDSTTIVDDLEVKEKDLLEKIENVRRAKLEIDLAREKYADTILEKEGMLKLAQLEYRHTYEMPTPDDKLDAVLSLKSAALDLDKAKVDINGYQLLNKLGYVSDAALKKQLVDMATKTTDYMKAKTINDLTLAGAPSEDKRVAVLAVADAKKQLHIAVFNRDADLTELESALELAQIDLANFERDLKRKRQELEWATVRAPVRGHVIFTDVWKGSSKAKSPVQVGETRNAGNELCTLCDTSNFRIRLWINESDIKNVALNQLATVRLPALPGREFKAAVTRLGVVAEDKNAAISNLALRKSGEAFVNVVQARLEFTGLSETDCKDIRLGFTADVRLQ